MSAVYQINTINANPLEYIKKITKTTVRNLLSKQMNIKRINPISKTKETVYNLKSVDELQYLKFYYPSDKDDEYYEMNKDYYVLKMFRLIDMYSFDVSITDVLYKMYRINTELEPVPFVVSELKDFESVKEYKTKKENQQIKLKNIEESMCSLRLYYPMTIKYNTPSLSTPSSAPVMEKTHKEIFIMKPLSYYNNNIEKFKDYFKLKYKEFFKNHMKSQTDKIVEYLNPEMSTNNVYIHLYPYFEQIQFPTASNPLKLTKNTFYMHNSFMFYSFLLFILEQCESNYVVVPLTVASHDEKDPKNIKTTSHRNTVILHKIIKNNKIVRVEGYHYEPHGTVHGDSYNKSEIEMFYIRMNEMSNESTLVDRNMIPFEFFSKSAVCKIGAQRLSKKYDIGLCTIFSTMWWNCFLNIIQNINKIEKKFKINTLSSVPLRDWIKEIDVYITNFLGNYTIRYPDDVFPLQYLLDNRKLMFTEHYKKYGFALLYSTPEEYCKYVKQKCTINKISKMRIEDFIQYYYDVILKKKLSDMKQYYLSEKTNGKNVKLIPEFKFLYDIQDSLIDTKINDILSQRFNIHEFDYYNLFVNYCYSLLSFILTSPYFIKEKTELTKLSTDTFSQKIKEDNNKIITIKKNDPSYIVYYKQELEQYYANIDTSLKEQEEKDVQYTKQMKGLSEKRKEPLYFFGHKKQVIQKEHDEEHENIIKSLSEFEKESLGGECARDSDCNGNLICDSYNQCNVKMKGQSVGDKCYYNKDCESGYCSVDRICRKPIKFCSS